MNTVFLAPHSELCSAYRQSLSAAGFANWEVSEFNALHRLFKQEEINVIFADYQMIDHKHFNVVTHITARRQDLVLFYFNQDTLPAGSVYEAWQDQLSQYFQSHNTPEMQHFLRIAAGAEQKPFDSPAPISYPAIEANYTKRREPFPVYFLDKGYPHTICKSAVVVLELLYKNRNEVVSLRQMETYLWQEHSEGHIKTLYTYIHSLRDLLHDSHKSPRKVVKVRKGYYSLLVAE